MSRPTYIYDTRTQMTQPVVVIYDDSCVESILMALYGCYPDFALITKIRMHKTGANERYLDLPPEKKRTR